MATATNRVWDQTGLPRQPRSTARQALHTLRPRPPGLRNCPRRRRPPPPRPAGARPELAGCPHTSRNTISLERAAPPPLPSHTYNLRSADFVRRGIGGHGRTGAAKLSGGVILFGVISGSVFSVLLLLWIAFEYVVLMPSSCMFVRPTFRAASNHWFATLQPPPYRCAATAGVVLLDLRRGVVLSLKLHIT